MPAAQAEALTVEVSSTSSTPLKSEASTSRDGPLVYLVATSAYSSVLENHVSFESGDVIRYLPGQAPQQEANGLGLGQVGTKVGLFPLRLAKPLNGAAVLAPPATPLKDLGSMSSDGAGVSVAPGESWLPRGERDTLLGAARAWWLPSGRRRTRDGA